MMKVLTSAVALSVFVSLPAVAQPKKMTGDLLDQVVAGSYCPPEEPALKGNNGWGNGADPINPGSDSGGTSASKLANASVPAAGRINTNPTDSSGR